MKNLVRVPLEILNELPSKHRYRFTVNNKLKLTDTDKGRRWYNDAEKQLIHKAKRIIEGSIWRNWDTVYSKISALIRHIPYRLHKHWLFSDLIFPRWCYIEKNWLVYSYRNTLTLSEKIREAKKQIRRNRFDKGLIYICPMTNVVRLAVRQFIIHKKTTEDWRIHYQKKYERKKSWRDRHKATTIEADTLLKMKNKPDLFKFYSSLKKKILFLEKEILENQYYINKISDPKYIRSKWDWHHSIKYYHNKTLEDRKTISDLLIDTHKLENGLWNVFYESNVYLYSLQKECHHF